VIYANIVTTVIELHVQLNIIHDHIGSLLRIVIVDDLDTSHKLLILKRKSKSRHIIPLKGGIRGIRQNVYSIINKRMNNESLRGMIVVKNR
jgi:hypothetical protein